jgi:tetratricopeptide (TPR) repeat protein
MKGDTAKTEALIDEYARRFPNDPEAYQLRANRFARKGNVKEAVAEYQKLLQVNPNYAVAYNSLGYYYAKMGDFARGEDYLKRYRFLAPDQANPYDSLGELYANIGRYDEAEESLKKALAIKPDFVASVGHLGTVAVGRGDFGAAAAQFARAAEITDTPGMKIEFEGNAAFLFAAAGRPDEARRFLERMDSDFASASDTEKKLLVRSLRLNQAAAYARLGDAEKAESLLGELASAGSIDSAAGAYEKPDAKKEMESSIAAIRGLIQAGRGENEQAVQQFTVALKVPENPMGGFSYVPYQQFVRVAMAGCLRQLGRAPEAEPYLKAVLARNPHFQPAVAEMARLRELPSESVARS